MRALSHVPKASFVNFIITAYTPLYRKALRTISLRGHPKASLTLGTCTLRVTFVLSCVPAKWRQCSGSTLRLAIIE